MVLEVIYQVDDINCIASALVCWQVNSWRNQSTALHTQRLNRIRCTPTHTHTHTHTARTHTYGFPLLFMIRRYGVEPGYPYWLQFVGFKSSPGQRLFRSWSFSVPPGKCRGSARIKPPPIPSKPFPMFYSWIILPSDAAYFTYWERRNITHKNTGRAVSNFLRIPEPRFQIVATCHSTLTQGSALFYETVTAILFWNHVSALYLLNYTFVGISSIYYSSHI
jgi:hypothetical protein